MTRDEIAASLATITPGQWAMMDGWGPADGDGMNRCARIVVVENGLPVFWPSGAYGEHDIIGSQADFEFVARAAEHIHWLLAQADALAEMLVCARVFMKATGSGPYGPLPDFRRIDDALNAYRGVDGP